MSHQRRNFYVKKQFQFSFILKFCLILLAGIVISTALTLILSQSTLTSSFENSRLVIKSTHQAILPTILLTNLITLAIITVAAILVTLFISHRIAGPIFRFESDLRRISEGDLTLKIRLRQKDQFTELADRINHLTAAMNAKVSGVKAISDRMINLPKAQKTPEAYENEARALGEWLKRQFTL